MTNPTQMPSHDLMETVSRTRRQNYRSPAPATARGSGPSGPAAAHIRLEGRDLDLLCDLFGHGAMLRSQIQRLHFPSLRRCNRRLLSLTEAGYVARSPLPFGPSASLNPGLPAYGAELVYRLGRAGAEIVAARLGRDEVDVRRAQKTGTPTYLAHALETVSFRLALEEAAGDAPGAEMRRFLPERLVRHAYQVRRTPGGVWQTEVFKPDGMVEITFRKDGRAETSYFFLETDLGNESAANFSAKLRLHDSYRRTGLAVKRYGASSFTTLVVTTGPRRRDHLRGLAEREHVGGVLFATFADVAAQGALAPVWHAPFHAVPVGLDGAGGRRGVLRP